ncbi:hypothetical protein WMF30_28030 [Sorangium sp. So ce134]
MTSITCRSALGGALALVFSLAVGCAVDAESAAGDPELGGSDEAGDPAEDVAEAQQEITAYYSSVHHCGNLGGARSFDLVVGGDCGPGYVRDSYDVWNGGNGSCHAVGWASNDARDCRVKVNIFDAATLNCGDCFYRIDQKENRCPHDKCATGAPLARECSPTIASVCDADSYCCTTSWDNLCVTEVRTIANSLACGGGSCAHTPCTTGAALTSGCDAAQANCVASICAVDSTCCTGAWDSRCVNMVASVCGKSCN